MQYRFSVDCCEVRAALRSSTLVLSKRLATTQDSEDGAQAAAEAVAHRLRRRPAARRMAASRVRSIDG